MATRAVTVVLALASAVLVSSLVMSKVAAKGVLSSCPVNYNGGPRRSNFPPGFVFGVATASYQVEGAWDADGKGKNIWDTFAHVKGKVKDGSNGDVACDQYNKYKEDVQLIKGLGLQAYRFSISWPRVIPAGTGKTNPAGIQYYNNLINELRKNGIQPVVTLYHWDLPQALQDKYWGFLDSRIIADFEAYARLCFASFGDRVKQWITVNEPQEIVQKGFGWGSFAPGRCSWCGAGNTSTEPYIAAKNILLMHAAAATAYKKDFQSRQKGTIGITLDCTYLYPKDPNSAADKAAAQQGMEFQLAWFADPVIKGSGWPQPMTKVLGSRLPALSAEEKRKLKGTYDFLGLNFYSAAYASRGTKPGKGQESPSTDRQVKFSSDDIDGKPIGDAAEGHPRMKVVPTSIFGMLQWVSNRYPGVPVFITENGVSQVGTLSKNKLICDVQRVNFYQDYLANVLKAINELKVPVKGYFAWSLLDNFEWKSGYTQRFGIYHVDFKDPNRRRTAKASARWWSTFTRQ